MFAPRRVVLLTTLGFLLAMAGSAPAAPLNLALTFGSLPSAQGWTYTPAGAHAGVPEANIFTLGGSVLTMNSMGQSNGVSGGSIFYVVTGGVTTTETKRLAVHARCLQAEGSAGAPGGVGGFFFGFTTGTAQFGFSITPTQVTGLTSAGTVVVPGTFDNSTAFHDFILDWTSATSWHIYRDGTLIYTGTTGFAVSANRIIFGDGTGGANAHGEITSLTFVQDLATPVESSTWGRIKALYR
jgi:hypothetical protein